MTTGKMVGAARAIAMALVVAGGALVPTGGSPAVGADPARDAWKYPESASLADMLKDMKPPPGRTAKPATGTAGGVKLDRLVRRIALTGQDLKIRSIRKPSSDALEFGPASEARSSGRLTVPLSAVGLKAEAAEASEAERAKALRHALGVHAGTHLTLLSRKGKFCGFGAERQGRSGDGRLQGSGACCRNRTGQRGRQRGGPSAAAAAPKTASPPSLPCGTNLMGRINILRESC